MKSEKARPGSSCRVLFVPYRDGICAMAAVFIEVTTGQTGTWGSRDVYTRMIQPFNLWLKILL
jgi:hypothetical protein